MTEKEKLEILAGNFNKLEETRKDHIRNLTRKLAEIHCGGGFSGENKENDLGWQKGTTGFYPA